jgi:hypothetical protein
MACENTGSDGRAQVRFGRTTAEQSAGSCVLVSMNNVERHEFLHTGTGWLHSFDTEAAGRGAAAGSGRCERGSERVGGNAARVAGASAGSASDQGAPDPPSPALRRGRRVASSFAKLRRDRRDRVPSAVPTVYSRAQTRTTSRVRNRNLPRRCWEWRSVTS